MLLAAAVGQKPRLWRFDLRWGYELGIHSFVADTKVYYWLILDAARDMHVIVQDHWLHEKLRLLQLASRLDSVTR